jgi:cytochrome P450
MSECPYDPFSPEVQADWGPTYRRLRAECPVPHFAGFGDQGFWSAARYDDVRSINVDIEAWTARDGSGPNHRDDPGPLNQDLPDRVPFRRLLTNGINTARAEQLEPTMRAETRSLLDHVDARVGFDLVMDLAIPLTGAMTATLMGIPAEQETRKRWRGWAEVFVTSMQSEDPSEFTRATDEMYRFFEHELTARREAIEGDRRAGREDPVDFLTQLAAAQRAGEPFDIADLANVAGAVFIGAQGTTTSLITNLALRLLERRDRWEDVLAHRELVPSAVEESLRFDPPVLGTFRAATHDVVLGETTVPAGAKVMSLFGSANRDEQRFSDGESFDIHRDPAQFRQHLTFGIGSHLCPGAPLGRMLGRVALDELLDRFPDLRLAGPPGPRIQPFFVWGFSRVPVAVGPMPGRSERS